MRKIITFILLPISIFFLLILLMWKALNSPWISEKWLFKIAVPPLKAAGLKLEGCKIAQQHFIWPDEMIFKDIACQAIKNNEPIDLKVETADLKNIFRLFDNTFQPVNLALKGFSVLERSYQVSGAQIYLFLYFKNYAFADANGYMQLDSAQWQDLALVNVRSLVRIKNKSLNFESLEATFLDAMLKGNFVLEYAPQLSYSMKVDFEQLAFERLAGTYPAVFSKIKGSFSGAFRVAGEAKKIKSLQADLNGPHGAQVQAQLLESLLPYIPQSEQHEMLQRLILKKGFVFFETAKFNVNSVNDKTLQTAVDMKSERFNLDLDLKIDVNLDEGISQVWDTLKRLEK